VRIDNESFLDDNAPIDHSGNAVSSDVCADAGGERQIRLIEALAPSHGEHQVLGRNLLRVDVYDSVSALAGRDGRSHLPRPLSTVGTDFDRNAAVLWPRHAQIYIGECPLLPIALIVDGEIAALEADLGEVAAIQRVDIEAFDPGKQRGEVGNSCTGAQRRRRVRCWN